MNKSNITVEDETGGKHDLQFFRESWLNYIELSKYLFGSKNPIYDINEMPESHKFYHQARAIADQLEIAWDTMTHEESNRIMLALLEDFYNAMGAVEKQRGRLAIEVKLKILNNNGKTSNKNNG